MQTFKDTPLLYRVYDYFAKPWEKFQLKKKTAGSLDRGSFIDLPLAALRLAGATGTTGAWFDCSQGSRSP